MRPFLLKRCVKTIKEGFFLGGGNFRKVADVLFGMKCSFLSVFDYRKTFGR
mgnify:CR=1 FL=1